MPHNHGSQGAAPDSTEAHRHTFAEYTAAKNALKVKIQPLFDKLVDPAQRVAFAIAIWRKGPVIMRESDGSAIGGWGTADFVPNDKFNGWAQLVWNPATDLPNQSPDGSDYTPAPGALSKSDFEALMAKVKAMGV